MKLSMTAKMETSTKVAPREPGWYWIRLRGKAETIVRVVAKDTGGVHVLIGRNFLDPAALDAEWGETAILPPHQRFT